MFTKRATPQKHWRIANNAGIESGAKRSERGRGKKNALHHGNNDVGFDQALREEPCVA